jgi:hypothetical protein
MGVALPLLTLAGAAVGAIGTYEQGMAQSKAMAYQAQVASNNAQIAQEQASLATQKGEQQATQIGLANRARQGSINAAMAANGVDVNSGSATNVKQSADILGMQDVQTARSNAAIENYGFRSQAMSYQAQSGLDTAEAKQAKQGAIWGAVGSLLGGAASAAGKFSDWQNAGG